MRGEGGMRVKSLAKKTGQEHNRHDEEEYVESRYTQRKLMDASSSLGRAGNRKSDGIACTGAEGE